MSAAPALPTLDEWMTMRARITEVIGERPATTLLSLLPSPVEGGLVTNNRIDLMELGLRGDLRAQCSDLRGELVAMGSELRSELVAMGSELRSEIAGLQGEVLATNTRLDLMETRLRAEISSSNSELRSEISAIRTEIADLRGDLRTEIASSASETLRSMRSMFLQLVGVMISLGGITLAVAKLL